MFAITNINLFVFMIADLTWVWARLSMSAITV